MTLLSKCDLAKAHYQVESESEPRPKPQGLAGPRAASRAEPVLAIRPRMFRITKMIFQGDDRVVHRARSYGRAPKEAS